MWFCVGPMNSAPRSTTSPPAIVRSNIRPPTRPRASSTATECPARATSRAAIRPESPAADDHDVLAPARAAAPAPCGLGGRAREHGGPRRGAGGEDPPAREPAVDQPSSDG